MKMKKYFLAILFFASTVWSDTLYVYPSVYYTFGNYSTNNSSSSVSAYATALFNYKTFATIGYENLSIKYSPGKYTQQNIFASVLQSSFPSYYKFSAGYLNGYSTTSGVQSTEDKSYLFSFDYYEFTDMFYYGIAASYLSQTGNYKLNVLQVTPRLEWAASREFYVSVKPNFTQVSDDRHLFSASGYVVVSPTQKLFLKLGGMYGKRALYFDSDMLTIYNQNDTQSRLYLAQADYYVTPLFKVTGGYQRAEFSSYQVDYFYAGLRAVIKF